MAPDARRSHPGKMSRTLAQHRNTGQRRRAMNDYSLSLRARYLPSRLHARFNRKHGACQDVAVVRLRGSTAAVRSIPYDVDAQTRARVAMSLPIRPNFETTARSDDDGVQIAG